MIEDVFNGKDRTQKVLSSFACSKDEDIVHFLHHRAVEFEELQKSRTYILIDEEYLKQHHDMKILGYFTIALKTFEIPSSLSTRARKELDGFSGKVNNAPITYMPCYLIGQLARNDGISKADMPGEKLLEFAFQFIKK